MINFMKNMHCKGPRLPNKRSKEAGLSLMEILVSLALGTIFSVAISTSTATSLRISTHTEAHHAASRLASDKLEQIAAIDSLDIDNTLDATESGVTYPGLGITFTRTTAVTTNADSSRTINVSVVSDSTAIPASVDFSTTFALWE